MSISHKKPNWTVRTRSREERWGYVLRASVGSNGQTPTVGMAIVAEFCLTLLDEVPGARAAFDALRALAADGWRYADNGPNAERFRGMKRDFRYGADWTPFLVGWDAIEAMVRAARSAFEADPDGEATERAWRIADDLVKRHHARVDRVVARMPDGAEAWMELDEFLGFVRNNPALADTPKKLTASELRGILDKLNADGKPGDPTWSLDLA